MRITAFILLSACLTASAAGHSQTVTLSAKNTELTKVFSAIESQTGYVFFYNYQLLKGAKEVTIDIKNVPLQEALRLLFADQPLDFAIKQKTIIITKKEPPFSVSNGSQGEAVISQSPPPNDITGRITNAQGEPLAGASVTIKRTGKGTIADANGKFTLKAVESDDIIVVTFIGYNALSVKVGDRTSFTLVMEGATNELDKVVVQGYGKTTQRYATGNIAKVTAEEISKQPVLNPLQALQGRVSGLVVTQTSGYASAPFKIELRGRNTIDSRFTSDPLYIIDGTPLTVLELGNGNYYSGSLGFTQNGLSGPASGQSPFFSFNPADIESIEVLKDADATSIYGSRGANGVIIITTKKGKVGKSKFDLSITQGINKITRNWNMLNTPQYLDMRREAFYNDSIAFGVIANPGNAYDLLVWDTTKYTNWQKYLWGGTGKITDAQLSLSGGDVKTQFRISAGYRHQTDILTVSGADQRAALSFNLNHNTLNNRLNFNFTTNYSYSQSDIVSTPGAVTLAPNAPSVYDNEGKLNFQGWDPVQYLFPFASLLQPYSSKTNNLVSNLNLNYNVFKGFSVKANLGYTNSVLNQIYLVPIASQDPTSFPTGSSQFGNQLIQNWIVEPQIEYKKLISKGKLNILAGASIQSNKTDGSVISAIGYTNDAFIKSPTLAPTTTTTGNFGQYRYNALFGKINYNWDDKYVINIAARRDGSSRFGPGKQFGNFGSVGIAWIFTNENMIKRAFPFLSFGKLRGSFGTTGTDAVGDYKYLTRWSSSLSTPPYNGILAIEPLQHFNPDYHWQINKKMEAAISLGFFNDRINLDVAWYRNRCDNQLVSFPLPAFTGFSSVINNSPALVQNMGWEFTINSLIIKSNHVKWSVSSNIGFNRNKLISYPNLNQSPYANSFVVGESLNIQKLLHYTGVDNQTGLYTFEDQNKDGMIDRVSGPTDDRFNYDLSPKFSGGIGSTVNVKSFDFSLYFNFIKQKGINALVATPYPGTIGNQPIEVLNRWRNTGDNTSRARFTTIGDITDSYFHFFSDGIYTDASFIRLQNVSLSYTIPKKWIGKKSVQNCKVFLQGQNLFTITSYKGIDPETQNFGSMPTAKVFTGGIQFNF